MQQDNVCVKLQQMLERLLKANWKQPIYTSDVKRKKDTYYQELVILSKYPFSLMEFQYSPQKKFPIATWQIKGQSFHVANVHLSSNRSNSALTVRTEQLNILLTYLNRLEGSVVIGGDFNSRGQEGLEQLVEQNFIDSWLTIHPEKKGYTFEPDHNPLAKESTLTGLPARFDRFYIRSTSNTKWSIEQAAIFAHQAFELEPNIFPSDHYGVTVSIRTEKTMATPVLATSPWSTILATYHSAIVILPDELTGKSIQTIRQQFDRKQERWMPHITLLYGFLPDRYFEQAANELSPLLKTLSAFELELKQYKFFSQKSETTAWLEPLETSTKGSLKKLQKLLQGLFVMKNTREDASQQFTPHLSIGQFRSDVKALELLPSWKPTSFKVNKIALISRHQEEAFKIRYTIDLETGTIEKIEDSKIIEQNLMTFLNTKQVIIPFSDQQIRSTVLEVIQVTCNNILGQEYQLQVLGSTRLGTNTLTSDLDTLIAIPKELDTLSFLQEVQVQLEGWYESARLIRDAQVPILKLQMDGITIDLLCVEYPASFISMDALSEKHRRYFSPQSWQAITGILEADSISTYVQKRLSLDTFQWFVKSIKIWATARAIKGNAFGFLGTYSWTILAAWVLDQIPEQEDSEDLSVLMSYFFDCLNQHDWTVPISLVEEHQYKTRGKQDRMPILTTIKPYYNSARNITRSTAKILQQEFQRGQVILRKLKKGKNAWEDLFAPVAFKASPKVALVVRARTIMDLQEACGWIEGHIVSLIIALEQIEELVVRPYPSITIDGETASIYLDLQYSSVIPSEQVIQQAISGFIQSFDFDNKAAKLEGYYTK